MNTGKYLSKYSQYDTHYHRTEPRHLRHIAWSHDEKQPSALKEIFVIAACIVLLVVASLLARM